MSQIPASQRENSLRHSACQLSSVVASALGKNWTEITGLDAGRAKPWVSAKTEATIVDRQVPLPRELFTLCYLAGAAPKDAVAIMEGRWFDGSIPTHVADIDDRLNLLSHFAPFKVKGYRETELGQILKEYSDRMGNAARAREVLTRHLGIPDLGDALKGVVALPCWADSALARLLHRPISDHWSLDLCTFDRPYLYEVDEAHEAVRDEEESMIEASIGAMGSLSIGDPDEDGSDFVPVPLARDLTVGALFRHQHLGQSFVVMGRDGSRLLLHFREHRLGEVEAAEAGVSNPIYYRVRVQVANPLTLDPQVRPAPIEAEADADTLSDLAERIHGISLLPDGANTQVLMVKVPTREAETIALAVGIHVVHQARRRRTR